MSPAGDGGLAGRPLRDLILLRCANRLRVRRDPLHAGPRRGSELHDRGDVLPSARIEARYSQAQYLATALRGIDLSQFSERPTNTLNPPVSGDISDLRRLGTAPRFSANRGVSACRPSASDTAGSVRRSAVALGRA